MSNLLHPPGPVIDAVGLRCPLDPAPRRHHRWPHAPRRRAMASRIY
jgi:hypothetical protein